MKTFDEIVQQENLQNMVTQVDLFCLQQGYSFTGLVSKGSENAALFENQPDPDAARLSMLLDFYSQINTNRYLSSGYFYVLVNAVRDVYEHAKILFEARPGQVLTYDITGVIEGYSSPWEAECKNPEEWAIRFARQHAENDVCMIRGFNAPTGEMLREVVVALLEVGVPVEAVQENASVIAYFDHDDLANSQARVDFVIECSKN